MDKRERSRGILKNVGLNLLSEGKSIRVKAHGYSMYPCIKPGATVLIEPLKIKGLPVPGEIIAIKRNEGLVVHRLIKIIKKNETELYIARGDSNARYDEPVKITMIAGRIVRAENAGCSEPANTGINIKPSHFMNRMRVILIIISQKIRNFKSRL